MVPGAAGAPSDLLVSDLFLAGIFAQLLYQNRTPFLNFIIVSVCKSTVYQCGI